MTKSSQQHFGLSSANLKWIALVFMTIDHLGAFGYEIELFSEYNYPLRVLGRIAAPLFLFVIIHSAKYTRNKLAFLLRLYLAGIGTGLFTAITNFALGESVGYLHGYNMLFTFFYIVLIIYMIDGVIRAKPEERARRLAIFGGGLAIIVLFCLMGEWFYGIGSTTYYELPLRQMTFLQNIYDAVLPSLLRVDYSIIYVAMGVLMYFAPSKGAKCAVYCGFCALCAVVTVIGSLNNAALPYMEFFNEIQCFMFLALPFMVLYSGEKGRGYAKGFFYIYYPVHSYLIYLTAYFIAK